MQTKNRVRVNSLKWNSKILINGHAKHCLHYGQMSIHAQSVAECSKPTKNLHKLSIRPRIPNDLKQNLAQFSVGISQ